MADEKSEPLRTPAGQEAMLDELDSRLEVVEHRLLPELENRMMDVERKEATRDRRADIFWRAVLTIGTGIIVGIAVALFASGVKP